MKYRKKPVIVEAEQWFPGKVVEGVQGPHLDSVGATVYWVETAHNQIVYLAGGDWVIKEPDGRGFYPCKPDIFAATYEAVEE